MITWKEVAESTRPILLLTLKGSGRERGYLVDGGQYMNVEEEQVYIGRRLALAGATVPILDYLYLDEPAPTLLTGVGVTYMPSAGVWGTDTLPAGAGVTCTCVWLDVLKVGCKCGAMDRERGAR